MDIIKTGRGITQTIKNVARLKEIISVLARNGFDEFIIKTGLHTKIPNFVVPKSRISEALDDPHKGSWSHTVGYRLRKSFEELGPSFIKLGQLLSTREDIFEPEFVSEMKKLQDQVMGIPFAEAMAVLKESLKKSPEEIFAEIDREPIGTASIGVVYKGRLIGGETVVIKIRRPGITKTIKNDFALLDMVIGRMERVSEEVRLMGISRIVRDFGSHLESELDYRVEALNCERIRVVMQNLDTENIFYIPKIYKQFSTDQVLVMEFLDGVPFSDAAQVNLHKEEIQFGMERGLRIFIHSLLMEGSFHADLHGGNFFLLKNQKIGLVDYGLVGRLAPRNRASLVAMLYALVNFNFENLVYEFLDVAEYETVPDVDELIRDVKAALSPFIGLTAQQVNVSVLLRAIMKTLTKHSLYLPREWFIVFRAFMVLDGVGKSLDMDFDVFGIVNGDINNIIKGLISKEQIVEEGVWLGRDILNSVRGLPRHLRWFLREFAKRNYAIEVIERGYEQELKSLAQSVKFLGMLLLSGLFTLSGVFLVKGVELSGVSSVPALSWVLWVLAFILFGTGVVMVKR